jgi:hypothetical protein
MGTTGDIGTANANIDQKKANEDFEEFFDEVFDEVSVQFLTFNLKTHTSARCPILVRWKSSMCVTTLETISVSRSSWLLIARRALCEAVYHTHNSISIFLFQKICFLYSSLHNIFFILQHALLQKLETCMSNFMMRRMLRNAKRLW